MKQLSGYHSETHHEEDEIDIKEIFYTLMQYKKSIILITLLAATIASYHAYFSPSIYKSSATLKIATEQGYDNFLNTPMGMGVDEIESETLVVKSYDIAKKTIEKLNIGTRYFTEQRMKTIELYKNSPFVVTSEFLDPELYNTIFKIIPIDQDKFRLTIETPPINLLDNIIAFIIPPKIGEEELPIAYNKIHTFSEKIDSEWFSLSVQKIYILKDQNYAFSIIPNEKMVNFVQARVSASSLSKFGNILEISFVDNVPMRATEIVNKVAESYIENGLDLKSESARKQLHFIDEQLKAIDKALKGSSEKLEKYKVTNIVVDLSGKAQMTASKLSGLQSKLYEINMDISIMEGILSHIKTQKDISSINMDYSPQTNPMVNTILKDLQTAITRYITLTVNYTDEHPEIIVTKRQIRSLKKSLRNALSDSLRNLKDRKIGLLSIIDEEEGTMKSFPSQEQELGQLTRSFMINEKIYSFLLEKRAETAIVESSTISNTRIIDKARGPGGLIKPKRKMIVLVGLILGFILGVAQAFLRDFLDNTIKTSDDIEKFTNVPLYGITPFIKSEIMIPYYQESIRSLWINLAFLKTDNKSKLISITSAISGEGKSFTLYNLSKMIAKNGEKSVILLDLDMRRASQHKYFDLDNTRVGMSELLRNKCTLEEAILPTEHPGLDVITSGPKTSNPTGLIMSFTLESIINDLSQKYDYIFLDTPPIGLVSDATKIMYLSDITLFIVKADTSTKECIKEINRLNEKEEVNMGIVLNGIDFGKKYGYSYKTDYMYGYLTN